MLIVDMPIGTDMVDRAVLYERLKQWQDAAYDAVTLSFLHEVKMLIGSAPHVKEVELVRCGECNRHEEPRDTGLKAFVWCNLYNTHKLKNGYCNCGERKDGEG